MSNDFTSFVNRRFLCPSCGSHRTKMINLISGYWRKRRCMDCNEVAGEEVFSAEADRVRADFYENQ